MSWNYENHLKQIIKTAQENVGLSNFVIEVCIEQDFVKREFMAENTIYVVVKYLTPDVSFGATTQPVQLLILTEQNSLEKTRLIFNNLVENNNFKSYSEETNYIKQQYSNPVVLSNFNEAAYGYRSVMYLSSTLYIMEGVSDIKNLNINLKMITNKLSVAETTIKDEFFDLGKSEEADESPNYVIYTQDLINAELDEDNPCVIERHQRDLRSGRDFPGLMINNEACYGISFYPDRAEVWENKDGTSTHTILYSENDYILIKFSKIFFSLTYSVGGYGWLEIPFPSLVTEYEVIAESNEIVEPLNFGLSYSMTPNTQPIPPKRIATSVKSVSTLAISMLVPFLSKYKFLKMITYMLNEQVSGNIDFILSFEVDGLQFTNLKMKITSAQIVTAPNEVPSFKIGLIK